MAIGKGPNRAKDFEDLAPRGAQDFDPEAENVPADESDAGSGDEEEEFDGREHYVAVGTSKLREPTVAALGPRYRGLKVDRAQLGDDGDDDDPSGSEDDSGTEFDGGGHSDDDGEASADEQLGDETDGTDLSDGDTRPPREKSSASRRELAAAKRRETRRGNHTANGEDSEDQTDASDSGDEVVVPTVRKELEDARKELAAVRRDDSRMAIAASMSQASKADAEKGRAIKKQRLAFDSLLNTRMKLQKSLIATNTLVGTPREQIDAEAADAQRALEAAETAAFSLWSSLNDLREDLLAEQSNKKRKRAAFVQDTPVEDLWSHLQAQEAESRPHRDAVIKKWHHKTQDPTVRSQSGGRLTAKTQSTIIDVLEEQLSQTNRLLQRAHAPRSCAPLQSAQKITEDDKIYDDADFYGLLLKELLEQKSVDSVAASNIVVGFQMRRENKTKRNVDTKASKGRKLRYTVHEKLQNFMAPEDRCTWGERRSDELFRSLFGQKMGLGEREDEDEAEQEDDVNMEEAGLRMFRS